MRVGFFGFAIGLATLVGLALLGLAAPASAQINPRSFVVQVADQWQTGKSQPILYGESVRRVVAEQTNNSGVYPSLVRLGPVKNVTLESTQPLARGTTWKLVATHEHGVSNWQVGYSERTDRVEYVEFTVARRATPGVSGAGNSGVDTSIGPVILGPTSPAPQPSGTSSSSTPPPSPSTAPRPAAAPSAVPPIATTQPPVSVPPPRPTGANDASTACQKFPNLC